MSFVKLSRPTKEMNTKNISGYPQDMLDYLSETLHDSIVCLLENFEVYVNCGMLEVVLHTVKKCAFFFGLPYTQQMEVVRASFNPFLIDWRGRVIAPEASTRKKSKLTKKERELLCISYIIINQNGALQYRQVLMMYQKKIKIKKGEDEIRYFRKRQDLFFVDDRGYVFLINVPAIRWNYVDLIISEKVWFCKSLQAPNFYQESMPQNELHSSWLTNRERPNKQLLQIEEDKSGQKTKIFPTKFSEEKTKIQKKTDLTEMRRMTERIGNGLSYLSQHFTLIANTDLLHLIINVLDDVKIYYLNLTTQSRDDFIKECFSFYNISSAGFILNLTLTKSCMLSDEEKIELLNVYQLSQQRNLHNIKMIESFPKHNTAQSTSVDVANEIKFTEDFTILKYGVSDIKTNQAKSFGDAIDGVLTVLPLGEKPINQTNVNLQPQSNTNWWESYLKDLETLENPNASRAINARQMNLPSSLYSLNSLSPFSSKCAPNDTSSPADTRQASNCCGCAALTWSEISIFEEDESYYNSLIESFLAMSSKIFRS